MLFGGGVGMLLINDPILAGLGTPCRGQSAEDSVWW